MPVYVDKINDYRAKGKWCHMVADSLDELHAMADKIGLKRSWFQSKNTPHYDLRPSKRALAIKNGAIEIDRKQLVQIVNKWRNKVYRIEVQFPPIDGGMFYLFTDNDTVDNLYKILVDGGETFLESRGDYKTVRVRFSVVGTGQQISTEDFDADEYPDCIDVALLDFFLIKERIVFINED